MLKVISESASKKVVVSRHKRDTRLIRIGRQFQIMDTKIRAQNDDMTMSDAEFAALIARWREAAKQIINARVSTDKGRCVVARTLKALIDDFGDVDELVKHCAGKLIRAVLVLKMKST